MVFATTAIRYGWVYLTALGVITGTTIYVVDNQRRHIKPEDIIEVALGTDERAMATQTGTNSQGQPVYAVARPSFVRTWKDTNGASISVTNTIGWHTDRDMMVSLDATIKALVPCYVDTNTIYDGSSNIIALTVTGLWASLEIGDKTNKFTREPAIGTNAATYGDYPWQIYVKDLQERYKVLNALKTTFKQTADSGDLRKMRYVNFTFWDRVKTIYSNTTTGVIWTNREPAIGWPGTPAYPEFYWPGETVSANINGYGQTVLFQTYIPLTWGKVKAGMEALYTYGSITGGVAVIIVTNGDNFYSPLNYTHAEKDPTWDQATLPDSLRYSWKVAAWIRRARWNWFLSTNLPCVYGLYFRGVIPYGIFDSYYSNSYTYANTLSPGVGTGTNFFKDLSSFATLSNNYISIDFDTSDPIAQTSTFPAWCDEPTSSGHVVTGYWGDLGWLVDNYNYKTKGGGFYDGKDGVDVGGPNPKGYNTYMIFDWQFNYCTVKYW